ncbi:MAG: glycoside hydrolase family 13 protein, partial [Actinomycetota bacterium]|nr:glycoside hydrolase family 13 protein [Actinomycetota bacterium]
MRTAALEAHHDGSELYVPAGTPSLGDVVPVRLRVPAGYGESSVHVRFVHDGEPFLAAAQLDRVEDSERWYVAEVPVHNPVTSYRFLVDHPEGYRWVNGRGTRHRDVPDVADFRLTVHEPGPDWLRDGVVYQVFPDRFARSADADGRELPSWAVPAASWDAEPPAHGREAGSTVYGGDLRGIAERLDHLERLGADVLYLTPVFEGTSVHRYDAASFDRVDALLGGNDALAGLARAVHARGMRLMGDLTTNHTGHAHEWFSRARADRSSPERDFYYWDGDEHVGWKGMPWLPKLDYASTELTHRMVSGPGSVTARWLGEPYGLDGWRVDVANMTGRFGAQDDASHVARLMRTTMAAVRPDLALVAELSHDPSSDLTGDGWHATMNYAAFTRPVWSWLRPAGGGTVWELPARVAPRAADAMVAAMREFSSAVPWCVAARQWNLLGSHDTPRIRTLLGANRALQEVAVGLLVTMPGTPMVFAGDEVGARGTNGEHARTTMPWSDPARWDAETFELYRGLIALRRESAALRRGGLRWIDVGPD